ncbi:non-ribosomal peptide synthetase [Actinorhabdospora filicis]|uniref:Non-ribosomal peptide synthetase n=1 Tax=Actinorhabdospora filicis TaxID=1785913 RepID=A0A9W6W7A1_9ACTN|nr:non-ribosomal peptide synthetase [Actinorhabdospora filicis]GLZ75743.1 non-ribosomal peptide synthetase [Actinorhabdospora filicis]
MSSYPMSFEQESIWLNDQFAPGTSRYVESWTWRLRGPLDADAVQAALDGVAARHEALRASLEMTPEGPRQRITPPAPVPLLRVDAAGDLDAAVTAAVRVPVPLDAPPLLRATLIDAGPEDAVLAVAVHHAVVDGWGLRMLDVEFGELYTAAVEGRAPVLPEPAAFGAYAAAQRAAGPAPGAHAYWTATMKDAPAECSFPLDHPRPAALSPAGRRAGIRVPAATVRGLRELCRARRVTPFAVYAAALSALLARVGGHRDVVIGMPVSRRDDLSLLDMMACLTDVMPLRLDADPALPFGEFAAATRDGVRAVMAHRNIPGSQLVRELAGERGRSRFPLFQVALTVDDADSPGLALPGLTAERLYPHTGTAKFDVFCHVIPEGGEARVLWEYAAEIFDDRSARRLAERFAALLADAVARPETPLGEILAEAPGETGLRESWSTGEPLRSSGAAHEPALSAMRAHPRRAAIVHDERTVTYAELDAMSAAVAGAVSGHARVAVHAPRSPEQAAAILGVLRAGACVVPLDPAYPPARLEYMLRDSGATALLGEASFPVPDAVSVLPLAPAGGGADAPAVGDDAAYLVYTSGSTGLPKGVLVPHRTLRAVVDWQGPRSGAPGGVTAQFAPISFDVSFQELFGTWADGGTLVLVDEPVRRDPGRLLDLIGARGVRRLFLPYVALQQLAEYAVAFGRTCPSLREVVSAGEQLFVTPAIRAFFAAHPGAVLDNQYGPSETHVVTAHLMEGPPSAWPERPPIGRAVPGTRVEVVDASGAPVPLGSAGEILVTGPQVGLGYLGEAFTGTYRTGDLARFDADGRLEFLGRRDGQVKIRGHRVEVAEVESAVKALPGVADAVVTVDGEGGDRRLVAHYVADVNRQSVVEVRGQGIADVHGPTTADVHERPVADAREPGSAALPPHRTTPLKPREARDALGRILPAHLVPALLIPVEAFPLTPSGKVDRAALPRPGAHTATATPSGPVEERLAGLFAELLGGDGGIGAEDDFFALGGDSLTAVRLLLRVRDEWGVHLGLAEVFAAPTVARLAALLTGSATASPELRVELPADIVAAREVITVEADPAAVLLTGATGYLGAQVLAELLTRTRAVVHCLVRGGTGRVRAALERRGLWRAEWSGRVIAVAGDLAAPRLGLTEEAFDRLASSVDAVYHVGAAVNLTASYASLRAANVDGTTEVLRLAARHRTVPVHHVSTVGVFPAEAGTVRAGDEPGDSAGLRNGYAQSKWAAERVIGFARERGLPVSVYRPTRITGPDAPDGDFLWVLLKGCVHAGLVPGVPMGFDLVSAAHVASALVELSLTGTGVHHLSMGRAITLPAIADALRSEGFALETVPMSRWRATVEADPGNPAYPLLGLLGMEAHLENEVTFEPSVPAPPVDARAFARDFTASRYAAGSAPPSRG